MTALGSHVSRGFGAAVLSNDHRLVRSIVGALRVGNLGTLPTLPTVVRLRPRLPTGVGDAVLQRQFAEPPSHAAATGPGRLRSHASTPQGWSRNAAARALPSLHPGPPRPRHGRGGGGAPRVRAFQGKRPCWRGRWSGCWRLATSWVGGLSSRSLPSLSTAIGFSLLAVTWRPWRRPKASQAAAMEDPVLKQVGLVTSGTGPNRARAKEADHACGVVSRRRPDVAWGASQRRQGCDPCQDRRQHVGRSREHDRKADHLRRDHRGEGLGLLAWQLHGQRDGSGRLAHGPHRRLVHDRVERPVRRILEVLPGQL